MGADGHINITNPEEIQDFLMNVLEDAIYRLLEPQYPPDDNYDTYTVNLSKDELVIRFLTNDEEVPGEEIVVKTIKMDPSHYWDIYNYLVSEFNDGLNKNSIPSMAWDYIYEDFESKSYIDELNNNGMNYTYYDNVGWYDNTIFDYFDDNDETEVECIYNNIKDMYKKTIWYDTFFKLFPDFDTFLNNLNEYKYDVSTKSYQVWT